MKQKFENLPFLNAQQAFDAIKLNGSWLKRTEANGNILNEAERAPYVAITAILPNGVILSNLSFAKPWKWIFENYTFSNDEIFGLTIPIERKKLSISELEKGIIYDCEDPEDEDLELKIFICPDTGDFLIVDPSDNRKMKTLYLNQKILNYNFYES